MLLRILSCLLCLSFCNISIADDTCVEKGRSIVIYPGAPNKCCKGLTLKAPPEGSAGSGGMCVGTKACVKKGKTVGVYPNAPQCCEGLVIQPAAPGVMGSAGKCVESSQLNINNSSRNSQDKDILPTNPASQTNNKTDGVEN
jgi:hypothetical protein